MKLKSFLKNNYPSFVIFGFVAVLFAANFKADTWLTGWDNLHPEFNFNVNIRRSIFAVWQEYQGLGLLGGMAHAADLLRQIALYLLSFLFPENSLRYIYVFSALLIGSLGAYKLIHFIHKEKSKLLALSGGLFYLLNLATVQQFFAPFEAFTAHFAALPWLLYGSIRFFRKPTRKNHLLLALILLLSTPAAYIPTLFLVYMLSLSILVGTYFLQKPALGAFLTGVKLYITIVLVNSFWLFPFLQFTLTNVDVNINSKINQMATETIYLQNKEFGTIPDVMLLKGFWFNNVNPNLQNTFTHMLIPWREWNSHILITFLGYLIFTIVAIGLYHTVKKKRKEMLPFLLLFIFSFGVLAIDSFPFSQINNMIRDNIKVLDQAFRFPFTKFSNLTSLAYAIFFTFGLSQLTVWTDKLIGKKEIKFKFVPEAIIIAATLTLTIFVFPAFSGNLLYEKERIEMPQEYFDLFTFFENQDPNTRIANFPQHTFWGWAFYKWGYGGSGFLWYGIEQPIIDRAFDVWSKYDENYYFEISQAIYSEDGELFEQILNKYQINWLIVDKSIYDAQSNKSLYVDELEEIILKIPSIKKTETFGNVNVYEVDLKDNPESFVFLGENLPLINSYEWAHFDKAYSDLGNYISARNQEPSSKIQFYPYRSLFTLKTKEENPVLIEETESTIDFTSKINPHDKTNINLPSFYNQEKIIPVTLSIKNNPATGPTINAELKSPEVFIDDRKITVNNDPLIQIPLPRFEAEQYPLRVIINGISSFSVPNPDMEIGTVFFNLKSKNIINVADRDKNTISEITINPETMPIQHLEEKIISIPESKSEQEFTVSFAKIDDNYLSFKPELNKNNNVKNCDNFRDGTASEKASEKGGIELSSLNSTRCISYYAQPLPHDLSYVIFIESSYKNGQSMRFWVENTSSEHAPIDTFLPKKENETSTFILSPMEDFGLSYAFHFYNTSLGRDETVNELNYLTVYPIFENYLNSIVMSGQKAEPGARLGSTDINVSHPNESVYFVENIPRSTTQDSRTLILSQAYDEGWKAYRISNFKCQISNFKCNLEKGFPSVFGEEITDHVMVNNWANGWMLGDQELTLPAGRQGTENQEQTIAIVYLPQYLQYLGFSLVVLTFAVILFSGRIRRNRYDS